MIRKSRFLVVAVLFFGLLEQSVTADIVLTFDPHPGNGSLINQNYGDRVTATSQGGFEYGLVGTDFTPNVVVSYTSGTHWSTHYGDLTNVLYAPSGQFSATLSADPGLLVRLHSLDLGGWFAADRVLGSIQVRDQDSTILYSQTNLLVQGAAGHTALSFGSSLSAQSLTISFDSTNLVGAQDTVGIDNIRFSQISAVPEPSAAMLVLASGTYFFIRRSRT
jgi:hypothetical protein